ncbi:sugar-binding protein [Salmonella enterica subsp. enterica]|uniref:Sugar-binding protein n=1 Tax=Salmonella enterica I TaxID=59201 RepID=A0A447PKZ5_SALET|nr:sugar-binding protein [Salmonella enterica subsp. enterica]
MTEKSAQEKLAELNQRDSNAETVENIATTGMLPVSESRSSVWWGQRQR